MTTQKPAVGTSNRQLGDISQNDQVLIARTTTPGADHQQYVWVQFCARRDDADTLCSHRFGGANGSDFQHRKCPRCQGGAPGLPTDGLI